jgi:hypothetical protein
VSDDSPQPPRVLLIGRTDEPCFAEALGWLREAAVVECFVTAEEAISSLRAGRRAASGREGAGPVRGVVFLMARPGEIERGRLETIHAIEPLARLVVLVGTWCEGEGRRGPVAPGVPRVYWHQWRVELPAALGLDEVARNAFSPLRMLTDGERLERLLRARQSAASDGLSVLVCCWTRGGFDALSDALAAGGFRAVWQHPARPVADANRADAWLWDGWDARAACPQAPAESRQVLLLDFPRLEDVQRARSSGIHEVLAKPFTLPQLWRAVEAPEAQNASEGV